MGKKTNSSYLSYIPILNIENLRSKVSSILPAAWSGLKDNWTQWMSR